MTALAARGYQTRAIEAVEHDLANGFNRVAVVQPTGTGKTVTFSHLASRRVAEGKRVLVLVHRDELAQQAKDKLLSVDPRMSVGIVKAQENEVDADVVIGSIQTLARESRREQIRDIGLVIADECHRSASRIWVETLQHYGCWESTPAVGFTATMVRNDGRGLGNIWERISFEMEINEAIEKGYLCDVRGQAVEVDGLDLAQIAKYRGDFSEGKLGDALESIGAGEIIARAYAEHCRRSGGTYRRGVMFTPTVATAYSFAEDMRAAGIRAQAIDGETSKEDRADIYRRYAAGEIDVLSNALLLVEGWDSPATEVCVMARPTQSPGLYTQAVGRVLRPFPGKTEALVLDVVGIAGYHRLQSLTTLSKVDVAPGESLAEAQERAEREFVEVERQRIEAPHRSREVELFAASHSVWLQTRGGVWFVPTSAGIYFLWPDEVGRYKLGYKHTGKASERVRPNGWVFETPMTLEYAMSHGETFAEEEDPTVALRDRAWRRAKPSPRQLDYAISLKLGTIEELTVMRRGAISDLLAVHFASKALDRFLNAA